MGGQEQGEEHQQAELPAEQRFSGQKNLESQQVSAQLDQYYKSLQENQKHETKSWAYLHY